MSEEDEEQVASEVSSMSEENPNNEPEFKKELIIHKVSSLTKLVTQRYEMRHLCVQQRRPYIGKSTASCAQWKRRRWICRLQYSTSLISQNEFTHPNKHSWYQLNPQWVPEHHSEHLKDHQRKVYRDLKEKEMNR